MAADPETPQPKIRRLRAVLNGQAVETAYAEWGNPKAPNVCICLHALTRNGRDFDALAQALCLHGYRVLCPDLVGRGLSGWLEDKHGYHLATYVAQMQAFLQDLGLSRVDWLGTSLGGLVGMALAARNPSPIRRLILNDVGPELPLEGLRRIAAVLLHADPAFDSLDTLKDHLKRRYVTFGFLPEPCWDHLARHSARLPQEGLYRLAFDPGIATPFEALVAAGEDVNLWPLWESVTCPTLVIRGEASDLLTECLASKMKASGPPTTWVSVPDCGHAPALMIPAQIAPIRHWLLSAPIPL